MHLGVSIVILEFKKKITTDSTQTRSKIPQHRIIHINIKTLVKRINQYKLRLNY